MLERQEVNQIHRTNQTKLSSFYRVNLTAVGYFRIWGAHCCLSVLTVSDSPVILIPVKAQKHTAALRAKGGILIVSGDGQQRVSASLTDSLGGCGSLPGLHFTAPHLLQCCGALCRVQYTTAWHRECFYVNLHHEFPTFNYLHLCVTTAFCTCVLWDPILGSFAL